MSTATEPQPFTYPPQHSFPPFYTLQPNIATRSSQLATWSTLLLDYTAHTRTFRLSTSHPIFHNSTLNRRLAPEDAKVLFESLVSQGRAEYVSAAGSSSSSQGASGIGGPLALSSVAGLSSSSSIAGAADAGGNASNATAASRSTAAEEILVFWRTPEEWFAEIDEWASESGQRNTVLTVWELCEGDVGGGVGGRTWVGMPAEMFRRCLAVGVKRGKVVLFGSEEEGLGVKFV